MAPYSQSTVFNTSPGEGGDGTSGGILTVGSAGWITGQSYMVMGPLLAAVRSVMMVGSPVHPTPLRMIETVASERVHILKTGSAVVRQLMTDPSNAARLDAIDTSCLRCATFCAEPVSVEVHRYAHAHITPAFINSYWATEHGGMVFSRDVSSTPAAKTIGGVAISPDARAWPLPWVSVALNEETSDVVITGPYPSLALTVFGRPNEVNEPGWKGDIEKYKASYWPANAGGFVQGDVARVAGAEGEGTSETPGFTFHGRSDEVINVNGNRVGTEQIERCLWGLEVGAAPQAGKEDASPGEEDEKDGRGHVYTVKDCCVVGAPDFVKGTSPVAFVVFEPRAGPGPDLAEFKRAAAAATASAVGAYAAPDHVFAVAALPKTITNKTARKTLQLLLAGLDAPATSLARKEVLPPLAAAVSEWRLTGATTSSDVDLSRYWDAYTFQDHNVQGKAIVPGAGWLCLLSKELNASRLSDVAFMRGVHDAGAAVRVVKRRRLVQASVGEEVALKAHVEWGPGAPVEVGPSVFGNSEVPRGRGSLAESMDVDTSRATSAREEEDAEPKITEDSTKAQHYRRCSALRLEYSGAYRALESVEWSGHVFRAEVNWTHLSAVLDAGLQVVCASVRGNTFIPVAVKDFQIVEGLDVMDKHDGMKMKCVVHGEILEQHPEFLVADLRYEHESVEGGTPKSRRGVFRSFSSKKRKSSDSPASPGGIGADGKAYRTFAAMGRVRFARVEGTKPRLQPETARGKNRAGGEGMQTLDPKTSLARLRQLTAEQRIEAIRSVIRGVVVDLTDTEVDWAKTVFDNGMHSLNAVELLSRVNEALGTGVTTKLVVADAPMADFATAVAEHAMTHEMLSEEDTGRPFPNVDYDNLNEIVRRRLAGKHVGQTPYWFLFKYLTYNMWRKAFQFFRIEGHKFLMNPPKEINLGVEVMMRRQVEFRDIDMNQHYTVEMIVGRSVDGVEQLMAKSGLTHIEHYYRRNLFAAKIQSTFHKELALHDPYIIRTKITKVQGPLMDIRVAFLDEKEVLCFEILWTILIVLDSNERLLLDWENVDLMEHRRLTAGPGKNRIEAPATSIVVKTAKNKEGN